MVSRLRNCYLYLIRHNWDLRFAGTLIAAVLILKGYVI